jgi:hypothetical protein
MYFSLQATEAKRMLRVSDRLTFFKYQSLKFHASIEPLHEHIGRTYLHTCMYVHAYISMHANIHRNGEE